MVRGWTFWVIFDQFVHEGQCIVNQRQKKYILKKLQNYKTKLNRIYELKKVT